MQPSVTSNDSYDSRRRRDSLRGATDRNSPNSDDSPDSYVSSLDSSSERLEQGDSGVNDPDRIQMPSLKSSSLDDKDELMEQQLRMSLSGDNTDITKKEGSFRQLNRKKLTSTSHSTRSLDSAAYMLEKERLEQIRRRPQSQRAKSQSQQRITVPQVELTPLDAAPAPAPATRVTRPTSTTGAGTGSASLRASLSEFKKSMLRHISIPSKHNRSGSRSKPRPSVSQELLTRSSSSARYSHSRSSVKAPTSDVTSASGGQRRTWTASTKRKQLKRGGSDTDLAAMSLLPGSEDTELSRKESITKKPSRSSTTTATAAGAASPGIRMKFWPSSQRLGGSGYGTSSRLSNSSSSSRHFAFLDDHDDEQDKPMVKAAPAALSAATSSDARGSSEDETDTGSKRKSKRVELVRELLSRDSLRIRDRARAAGTLSSQIRADERSEQVLHPTSEFSTEEETIVSDSKQSSAILDELQRDKQAAAGIENDADTWSKNQLDLKEMKSSSLSPKPEGSLPASSRHSQQSPTRRIKSPYSHETSSDKKGDERRRSLGSSSRRTEGGSYKSLLNPSSRQDSSMKNNPSRKESKAAKQDDALRDSRTRQQSPSKTRHHRRRESAPSSLSMENDRGRDGRVVGGGSSKKSPKTLSKTKDMLEEGASERSLSVDDLTRLDDSSSKSLVDSAGKEKKKKRRSRKKTDRLSSSSPSWRSSHRKSLRNSKSASDPNMGRKLDNSSGAMDLSASGAEMEASVNLSRRGTAVARSRTEEKLLAKKGGSARSRTEGKRLTRKTPTRSRTEEKPHTKKNASKMRTSGSSRSLGRSPKKPSSGETDKRNVEREAKATEHATSTKMKKSPNRKKTDASKSVGETQKQAIASSATSTLQFTPGGREHIESRSEMEGASLNRDVNTSDKSIASDVANSATKEGEKPAKEISFSSLDAIANAPKTDIDLNDIGELKARDSLDALRLHAPDIFHDSPNDSPLSKSVPMLWGSSAEPSALDRLVSSMPNLDHHEKSSKLGTPVKGRDELTSPRATSGVDNEGIFQDDSDESRETQGIPDLEPMCIEPQADVMTRIADQLDKRLAPQTLRPRPSTEANLAGFNTPIPARSSSRDVESDRVDHEGIFQDDSDDSLGTQELPELEPMCDEPQTDIMTMIANQVDEHLAPQSLQPRLATDNNLSDFSTCIPTRSPVANVLSPRAARTVNSKGKLDRGPAIPRRSSSFENDNESLDSKESSVEIETIATAVAHEEDITAHPVNVSGSMQFLRTADKGWVQTPLDNSTGTAADSSAGDLHLLDRFEAPPKPPRVRRRASTGDLDMAGASVSDSRWQATSSVDTVPIISRRSFPSIPDRVSHSMDEVGLRTLFSLPRPAGAKQSERTYLPVSLQSAARRYERAGKPSPDKGDGTPRAGEEAPKAGDSATSRVATAGGIAVDTGLSDMFEMIGELEEDLVRFENQVAFLRAQRARRMQEDSSTED